MINIFIDSTDFQEFAHNAELTVKEQLNFSLKVGC